MKYRICIYVLVAIFCVSGARAFSGPEPTGFDKVKFKISLDEVRKAYPALQPPAPGSKMAALKHPKIQIYVLPKHKLPDFEKPTDINLQFWDGKLWLGQVFYGDNDAAKVEAYLRKTYGVPDHEDENYLVWTGKIAGVVASRKQKNFEVHDETLSDQARQAIFGEYAVRKGGDAHAAKQTPSGSTTPAAAGTPTAAPPAPATPAK
jgi:hypothetical protein